MPDFLPNKVYKQANHCLAIWGIRHYIQEPGAEAFDKRANWYQVYRTRTPESTQSQVGPAT